jgi:hypothetical protein
MAGPNLYNGYNIKIDGYSCVRTSSHARCSELLAIVARRHIFKPNIFIWVNSGEPCN